MKRKYFVNIGLFLLIQFQLYSQEHMTILHWNDFHSQNMPFQIRMKNNANGSDTSYFVGGSAVLSSYLKKFDRGDSATLVLNAGDDFQGSPVSSMTNGESQIQLLNLLRPDAMTLGNHEFDYGSASLLQKIKETTFPIVSANLVNEKNGKPFAGTYIIKQIGKIKVAVIGLMTTDLSTLSIPENIKGLKVSDPGETVNRIIPQLKEQKVNLIIALTHLGVDQDSILALHAPDLDVIVGGHSHTPLFRPKIVNGIYITQAGTRGRWLGKIDLAVDITKDTVVGGKCELIECRLSDVKEDSIVRAKALEFEELTDKGLSEIIGELKTDWIRAYNTESNIGNWIADAMRSYARSDIAFQNSGGIRKDLLSGKVSVRDIWEICPFNNTLVTFTASGQMLRKMLQFQLNSLDDYLQFSGLSVVYRQIEGKKVIHNVKVNGKLLQPSKEYSIVTNNYVAAQSKKYFGVELNTVQLTPLSAVDRDVLIDAVKTQKVISSSIQGRLKEAEE